MTFASTLPAPAVSRRLGIFSAERVLFAATVLWAAALVWLAPRPPMIDVPQHAAQVALWRDLIEGVSPWRDIVHVNLATPYLLGYGLLLPLSFVMPLASAIRLLLSADVLLFVGACIVLRRAFGGDRRLDWLCLVGYFGFAWKWGFLTFLLAAPLGLLFLALAGSHARDPGWRRGAGLALLGTLLLASHALVFLMAGVLGGLLALRALGQRRTRRLVATLAPYLALAAVLLAFRLVTRNSADAFRDDYIAYGVPLWLRPAAVLAYVTDRDWGLPVTWAALLAALAVPAVLGCGRNRQGGAWLLAGLGALLLAVPGYAMQTAFLFQRFALFVLPFAAVAVEPPAVSDPRRARVAALLAAGACWTMLGVTTAEVAAFGRESRSFETVLGAAEPGRRALALIFDRASPAAGNDDAYMHFAAWYQADKGGFVDFNFAWFPPQVVRFREGQRPEATDRLNWMPETWAWPAGSAPYDLVFFRGSDEQLAGLRAASPCPLPGVAQDGSWHLLRATGCIPR